jgi:hypothetical protein
MKSINRIITVATLLSGLGLAACQKQAAEAPAAPAAATQSAVPAAGQPAAVVYTCPMHPEVQQAAPGKCPTCGMDLVKKA